MSFQSSIYFVKCFVYEILINVCNKHMQMYDIFFVTVILNLLVFYKKSEYTYAKMAVKVLTLKLPQFTVFMQNHFHIG